MSEHVVTCAKMKELERLTDEAGLSYYQMMENAGRSAAATILEKSSDQPGAQAIVFCGKGNNGGDGFVVARILCRERYLVTVVLVDGEPKTPDAITNYELLEALPVNIEDMTKSFDIAVALMKDSVLKPAIVVDAIYGTGFHGELRPNAATATDFISAHRDVAYALDIPSGLTGDMASGDPINKNSSHVAATITFHAKKPVHLVPEAQEYCGEIVVADIGIIEK